MYFTTIDNIKWFIDGNYGDYIVDVVLPTDAKIHVQSDKFKADKIIIKNKTHIDDYPFPQENMLGLVSKRPSLIKQVQYQTPEICMKAVQGNAFALQFVKEQTPEICMEAVRWNALALQFVKEQTPEICSDAVWRNVFALKYVKEQTPEMCMDAIMRNGLVLEYVKKQTPEICKAAVWMDGYALEFVKEQTPEICMAAVRSDGCALQFVKKQTPAICRAAIINDERAREYVKIQNDETYLDAPEVPFILAVCGVFTLVLYLMINSRKIVSDCTDSSKSVAWKSFKPRVDKRNYSTNVNWNNYGLFNANKIISYKPVSMGSLRKPYMSRSMIGNGKGWSFINKMIKFRI